VDGRRVVSFETCTARIIIIRRFGPTTETLIIIIIITCRGACASRHRGGFHPLGRKSRRVGGVRYGYRR